MSISVLENLIKFQDERSINMIIHPKMLEQEALLDALLIRTIKDIIIKTPNDQDLGKTIREIFNHE